MHAALQELTPQETREVTGAQYAPPIDIGGPHPYPAPPELEPAPAYPGNRVREYDAVTP